MSLKRKQITVNQFHLNNLQDNNGKLTIAEPGREIAHFRNFYIQAIETILDKDILDNTYFILKFDEIKDDDVETLELYTRTLKEGIWLNDIRYVKSVKSPSMVRTQKTLFVREDIAKKVLEYVSLNKIPTHTVVSKLEAAYGISLSSVLMVESMPRIVVIKDMKKIITEDVEVIRNCDTDPEQLASIEKQIQLEKAIKEEWKENRPSNEDLKKLPYFDWMSFDTHKSKNAWYKERRRIKLDQISKPAGYGESYNVVYPVYEESQTEEIEFPKISSETIGKKVEYIPNHQVPMTMFDGQSLGSFEWFEKVSKELNLKYVTNGIQGRLPYFKSLIVRFDFKKWCKENGVTVIVDCFNVSHKVSEIDIIATESCWKAFQDYSSGKKECLFSSIDEWYELMNQYRVNQFGVANYAKDELLMNEFTPLNYQFIYALPKLSFEDLKELSKPYEKLLYKVKEGKDIGYIKAFLKMMDSSEGTDYFSDKCLDMISIDERLIHDKKIEKFLRYRVSDELKNLMKGRIPIRGGYRYITQCPIAFMEWAVHRKEDRVKGFLDTPYTVYKNGTTGEYLLMRNPTTSPKETVRATFIESDNEYVKHLNSIIVTGINDLHLPKYTADVDGDTVLYTKEKILLNAMLDNVPLIHEGDKQFSSNDKAEYTEYNLEEIINYEKHNTSSMIGILTNWNTKLQDLALAYEDYKKADLVVSVNKIYQMQLIDAAKTGEKVEIAYPIQMHGKRIKKPYFMINVYGGKREDYSTDIRSPLNQYVHWMQGKKEKIESTFLKDIDPEYYQSIDNPVELFQYRKQLPHSDYINEIVEKLKPLYEEYSNQRNKVRKELLDYDKKAKMKQNAEERDLIRSKYATIRNDYKFKCRKVEPNLSILASAAVELSYRLKGTYDFAWDVAYEGMRFNALENRVNQKTTLYDLGSIDTEFGITGIAHVIDGEMVIKQAELNRSDVKLLEYPLVIDTGLEDGKYSVLSIMGRHFAVMEIENNHPEYMCHYWYEVKEEKTVGIVDSKNIRFLTRGKPAKDVIGDVLDNEFTLITVPEKGYANVYKGEEMLCSIAPDFISKKGIKMGMNGWKVVFHSVNPPKENQKSFTANVTISAC
ncbi:hypothetical protein [Fictibacillus phosphorivorans]|uniref:hypothetical protein n=1 Tax=Fictibacillus phosphorivorans TaxID=1221500 RepID=UPI0011A0F57F|nr:hypothetical protein [Fictibacillus phosphorivorans]